MSDDREFDQIYESLPAGLVLAACTSKSFGMMQSIDEDILASFCRALKGAAIRRGSNAMHFWWGYSPKNWKTRGIEHFRGFIDKHNANGIRLFLLKQPAIDLDIAGLIHEKSLSKNVTTVLVTVAADARRGKVDEDRFVVKKGKEIHFHDFGPAVILLHRDRPSDDWYSAEVHIGPDLHDYGPLYFVSESPQPPSPESPPQPMPQTVETTSEPRREQVTIAIERSKPMTAKTEKSGGIFHRLWEVLKS